MRAAWLSALAQHLEVQHLLQAGADRSIQGPETRGLGTQLILSQRGTELKMGTETATGEMGKSEKSGKSWGKLSARGERTSNCPIVAGAPSCGEMSLCQRQTPVLVVWGVCKRRTRLGNLDEEPGAPLVSLGVLWKLSVR